MSRLLSGRRDRDGSRELSAGPHRQRDLARTTAAGLLALLLAASAGAGCARWNPGQAPGTTPPHPGDASPPSRSAAGAARSSAPAGAHADQPPRDRDSAAPVRPAARFAACGAAATGTTAAALAAARSAPPASIRAPFSAEVCGGATVDHAAATLPRAVPLESGGPVALEPFFRALAALERGEQSTPLRILQLGDSHTAADRLSGRLRARLQARFGDAGRGMLPVGRPFNGFWPRQVQVGQTPGWEVASSFASQPAGLFGVTGFRLRGADPAQLVWLEYPAPCGFDVVLLETVVGPGLGSLELRADGRPLGLLATADPAWGARTTAFLVPEGALRLDVAPVGDGPVELLSWTTERQQPGIVYDSQGIVGATVDLLDAWDPETVARELGERAPALILLAFGTNEGFNNRTDPARYARSFRRHLQRLRRAAPGAAILVVGPPDGNRLDDRCRRQLRRYKRELFKDLRCAGAPARAGEQQQATGRAEPGAAAAGKRKPGRRPSQLGPLVERCPLRTPATLDMVRQAQRQAALEEGHTFWDWAAAMGGPCSMHTWFSCDLAFVDHVHLTAEGYEAVAEVLFRTIMEGYQDFKGKHL